MSGDRRRNVIDVPYVSQGEDDVGCVWACVAMILQYYRRRFPDLPNLDMETIKDGVGYLPDGTPLEGVTGINRRLRGTSHQLAFEYSDFAHFPDIEREIDAGFPVIAWIKQNKESGIHHSIVIKEVNTVDLRVYVNDPDPDEPREHTITDFMNSWNIGDRILIRARVTDRPTQRRLEDSQ